MQPQHQAVQHDGAHHRLHAGGARGGRAPVRPVARQGPRPGSGIHPSKLLPHPEHGHW